MQNKIPKNAKRVFKGVIFDVYQWKEKMYDGSYGVFEAAKRQDTISVIAITKNNKFIVLKQEQPYKGKYLSLAGGRVEKNEKPILAAKRELLEETGYVPKKIKLYITDKSYARVMWNNYTYIAYGCERKDKQNLDNGERIQIKYLDFPKFYNFIRSRESRVSWDMKYHFLTKDKKQIEDEIMQYEK